MDLNEITQAIIGAAIEVHRHTGPGLLESAYQICLEKEFEPRGIAFDPQRELPVTYKGILLDCGYRLDFVVMEQVVIEVKSVAELDPIFEAQVLTYLKLGWKVALIINFNVALLKDGIKRVVLGLEEKR